jgi:hypothetical protein
MRNVSMRHLLIAGVCGLAMGCGDSKDDAPPPVATQQPTAETPADTGPSWQAVYSEWMAGEIPEDACGEGRDTLKSDRTLTQKQCDNSKSKKISEADFASFEAKLAPVLSTLKTKIKCVAEQVMDAGQKTKVLMKGSSNAVTIFTWGFDDTCYRGTRENAEAVEQALGDLIQKYFPADP